MSAEGHGGAVRRTDGAQSSPVPDWDSRKALGAPAGAHGLREVRADEAGSGHIRDLAMRLLRRCLRRNV